MDKRPHVEPSFSLDAGVGVLAGPGGVGPAVLPVLGLSYRATAGLSLRLRAGGPAFAADLDVPAGTISVRQELASLELLLRLPVASESVRPLLLAGAGAFHFDVTGTAQPPYQGKTGGVFAAHVDLGAGAAVRLAPRVFLLGDVRAMWVAPRPFVRAAGQEVGGVGRPSVLGETTIDVRF
jgi:hypothetical protein